MCGRYTLIKLAELPELFPWIDAPPKGAAARFNVAPQQPILAVANDRPDAYDLFFWGLVPHWAKDPSIGNRMINARAETLAEKPAFRNAYKRRRCLIPADGFYEWRKEPDGKTKTPMYVQLADERPFAFGGLWETWTSPDGSEMRSATIITVAPNELMETIHNRMPLIVPRERFDEWLTRDEKQPDELDPLLRPFPADEMTARPVSRTVNNPRNETPDCVAPVAGETLF